MSATPNQFCHRCGMVFVLAAPGPIAEITRCVETGCGRRFWHQARVAVGPRADRGGASAPEPVVVGVDPSWRPVARAVAAA